MTTHKMDLILRGYPSRIRFAEWQKANSLPPDKLPRLSKPQKARAHRLGISDHEYAIALKAAELARERAVDKMEKVARLIIEAVHKRDPQAEVTALVWDFLRHEFKFLTRVNGREDDDCIPPQVVDDVLLEKEGAEQRLKQKVDFLLGGWAE